MAGKVHDLKLVQPFFDDVRAGRKTFEVRRNDRRFELGDVLVLREYVAAERKYTGRTVSRRVVYVADLTRVGAEGLVGLGIEPIMTAVL